MSAYFPNGSAGDMFTARWCDNCEHDRALREDKPGARGCQVWIEHLFHNYKAEGMAREILDALIVDGKLVMEDGSSPCRMFLEER